MRQQHTSGLERTEREPERGAGRLGQEQGWLTGMDGGDSGNNEELN